jgi:uncharacterized small protein (DUF1192 family)
MSDRRTKAELAEACQDAASKLTQLTERVKYLTSEVERLTTELDDSVSAALAQDLERRKMELRHSDEMSEVLAMFHKIWERINER